ncbi:hypothetical protein NNJEOMEG_01511 [Fundidesulfovibrio magnetotacticus]|uniref:histidine kinase n=1 Tax=Fundidesulfovibrio magnetotacticus TaxID=2730080 RepID=A0A6V8LVI0_9BACT|nr:HAMP domain-containing protein [Fundidesulfovibrio magnetotacticus]GFK93677.1 hypothetical protein NNJEOMEG_01511 [Fundidesulfovibrio magnetotacticus]
MRVRIVLVLLVVLVCYVAVYGTVFDALVYPRFGELENERAQENLGRAVESLEREALRLSSACAGLAALEAAGSLDAAFVQGMAQALAADAPRYAAWRRPGAPGTVRGIPAAGEVQAPATPKDLAALLETPAAGSVASGFLWADGRPLLAAFRGGPGGRVLLAQALDGGDRAASVAPASLTLYPAEPDRAAPPEREALAALAGGARSWMSARDGYVHAYALLSAPAGTGPGLLARASLPETLGERGRAAARMGAASGILAGALLLLVLLAVLDAQIGSPLERFTRHVRRVRQERDLGARTGSTRADEIGLLSREFDAMLAEIQALHRELAHQAFRLGMAEAAAGVLHELRNALAPLPGLLETQRRGARGVSWENLARAVRELEADPSDAGRRADLGAYLGMGLERARQALEEGDQGASRLGELFARVEAILMAYDAMALASRRVEPLDPAQALLDAAAGLTAELDGNLDFSTDPSLDSVPPSRGNPQGLRLVVETLLVLAASGASEAGRARILASGGVEVGPGGGRFARLRLDLENLRDPGALLVMDRQAPDGMRSPHWCANAMNAMDGALRVRAEEPARRVVIDLLLPLDATDGEDHAP